MWDSPRVSLIINDSENEEMEFEDDESEQKECNSNDTNQSIKNDEHFVPPCLLPFYESEDIVDLSRNERNVVNRNRNEFVVHFNLGIIVCFVAPTADCECWKVYCLSVSPSHSIGGIAKCTFNTRTTLRAAHSCKRSTRWGSSLIRPVSIGQSQTL